MTFTTQRCKRHRDKRGAKPTKVFSMCLSLRPSASPRRKRALTMKWIRYSKYTGEDLGIEAEDHNVKPLADFLLESGFNSQYTPVQRVEPAHPRRFKAGHPAGPRTGQSLRRSEHAGDDGAPAKRRRPSRWTSSLKSWFRKWWTKEQIHHRRAARRAGSGVWSGVNRPDAKSQGRSYG